MEDTQFSCRVSLLLQGVYLALLNLECFPYADLCSNFCIQPKVPPSTSGKNWLTNTHIFRPSWCPPIISRGSLNVEETLKVEGTLITVVAAGYLPAPKQIKFYWNIAMLTDLSMAAFTLQRQSWVTATETVCSTKPRIFTLWTFTNVCQSLTKAFAASCFVQ